MNGDREKAGNTLFGEILLCGERNHGQYPPQKNLRRMNEFILVYLFDGSGTYREERGSKIELGPGSCLIIPPGTAHAYHPNSPTEWSEVFFVFSGAVFDTWQTHGLLPEEMQHLSLRPIDYWLPKLRKTLVSSDSSIGSVADCCQLQLLLADINASIGQNRFPAEDLIWLEQAKQLIETGLTSHSSLEETATVLRVSYDHFRKRFTKTCGMSPSTYRTKVQISQASRLLLETRISITEISEQLGFCDVFHLSKRFKQSTGLSPQQYRKRF